MITNFEQRRAELETLRQAAQAAEGQRLAGEALNRQIISQTKAELAQLDQREAEAKFDEISRNNHRLAQEVDTRAAELIKGLDAGGRAPQALLSGLEQAIAQLTAADQAARRYINDVLLAGYGESIAAQQGLRPGVSIDEQPDGRMKVARMQQAVEQARRSWAARLPKVRTVEELLTAWVHQPPFNSPESDYRLGAVTTLGQPFFYEFRRGVEVR